jgi:stage II sporulation protein D
MDEMGYRPAGRMPMTRQMRRQLAAALAALVTAAVPAPQAGAATIFTVTGHGYGHGIGLGQYGALGYAQHGAGWRQIVSHYYPGTALGAVPAGHPRSERVLLSSGMTSLGFSAGVKITIRDERGGLAHAQALAPGSYTLAPGLTTGRWRIVNSSGTAVIENMIGPIDISPWGRPLQIAQTMPLGWANAHWWGWFRAIPQSATAFDLVEDLSMQTYLQGVVPSEMPSSWPAQALASQAVVARSYAYATQNPGGNWDVVDGVGEAYGPAEHWTAATSAAVAATSGTVVLYGGAVAVTFYSASSGGQTDSEVGAWDCGSCGEPYLQPVRDPYDAAGGLNPYHTWAVRTFGPGTLAADLGLHYPVASLAWSVGSASQRMLRLAVTTTSGHTTVFGGYDVQGLLDLRSTFFRLTGVTLSGPAAAVRPGQSAAIAGRITPAPASPVALQRRIGSGTWQTRITSLRIGPGGTIAITARPAVTCSYRLVLASGAVSPVVTVTVSS